MTSSSSACSCHSLSKPLAASRSILYFNRPINVQNKPVASRIEKRKGAARDTTEDTSKPTKQSRERKEADDYGMVIIWGIIEMGQAEGLSYVEMLDLFMILERLCLRERKGVQKLNDSESCILYTCEEVKTDACCQ